VRTITSEQPVSWLDLAAALALAVFAAAIVWTFSDDAHAWLLGTLAVARSALASRRR